MTTKPMLNKIIIHAYIVLLCTLFYNTYLVNNVYANDDISNNKVKDITLILSELRKTGTTVQQYVTKAKEAILVDYETGTVIFEKNAYEKMTPSSMTKVMALYSVFEGVESGLLKLEEKHRIGDKPTMIGGSRIGLSHKDEVNVELLVRAIAIQSGNDASIAIAEKMSGSESKFVENMTAKAAILGLQNSHFVNASGWPHQDHYSSAADLALLSIHLIKDFPQYYHYFSEKEMSYKGVKYKNRNKLLGIDGVDGIKTGHTESGGFGMIVSAVKNGHRVVGVVNGLETEKERDDEALRMVQYAGDNCNYRLLYNSGDIVLFSSVLYGKKSKIPLVVHKDFHYISCGQKDSSVSIRVEYNTHIKAPIDKGVEVGRLTLKGGGIHGRDYSTPLYTGESIQKGGFFSRISSNIRLIFGR